MKKYISAVFALVMCVSCMQEPLAVQEVEGALICNMEQFVLSKTSLGTGGSVFWCAGDEIAVFNDASEGVRYRIADRFAGMDKGAFERVEDTSMGMKEGTKVAFYPYSEDLVSIYGGAQGDYYLISGVEIPSVQQYVDGSFAGGAFPMVAVSRTNSLSFRNVLGGLKLRMIGDMTVRKITVSGNAGELLSGKAVVKAYSNGREPEITMDKSAGTAVSLDCGETGVTLSDVPTEFVIAIPPTLFRTGFTVTVTDMEGNGKVLKGAAMNSVLRSSLLKMPKVFMGDEEFGEADQLLTVMDLDYDGFKMHVKVPESVKNSVPGTAGSRAIRCAHYDIMTYNYMIKCDDYPNLLYNNLPMYTTRDTTIVYSEESNWYDTGRYISPGEPVVYVAGEFEWMEEPEGWPESDIYQVNGFFYPSGWEPGYYLPCLDPDKYHNAVGLETKGVIEDIDLGPKYDDAWTGAFQRKIFRTLEPEKMDAKVDVKLVDVSPIDATIHLVPDEGVDMYTFGMFDESAYNMVLELCEGREDYLQWAVTSHFASDAFGTREAEGPVEAKLTNFYYRTAITEDTNYYVLVTAKGDSMGSKQSFTTYTFRTTEKTMEAPTIEVTTKNEHNPYSATFNIRCVSYADNPLVEAYYAADYVSNWLLQINSGHTYFSLTDGNNAFSAEELMKINSEEGLDMVIPTVDGRTIRCAVVGYNEEYTPNDLQFQNITDCPSVADYEAPYATSSPMVDTDWYLDLADEWTATATLRSAKDYTLFEHKSKITLLKDLYDYPEELPEDVMSLYTAPDKSGEPSMSRDSVNALWQEFKMLAEEFTEERLENHNRLLGLGWMDKDSYHRLSARTPYDLFKATDYSSVDVMSLYFDFGPKWFLETKEVDGKPQYTIPMDSRLLPPGANWSLPFYLAGMELENYQALTYAEDEMLRFPVTVSEDRDTITIHPMSLQVGTENMTFYPQMIGIDNSMGMTVLVNPVVSEIVLTRGWTETKSRGMSIAGTTGGSRSVPVDMEVPDVVYKSRTGFPTKVKFQTMEVTPVTMEQFRQRADEMVSRLR